MASLLQVPIGQFDTEIHAESGANHADDEGGHHADRRADGPSRPAKHGGPDEREEFLHVAVAVASRKAASSRSTSSPCAAIRRRLASSGSNHPQRSISG